MKEVARGWKNKIDRRVCVVFFRNRGGGRDEFTLFDKGKPDYSRAILSKVTSKAMEIRYQLNEF